MARKRPRRSPSAHTTDNFTTPFSCLKGYIGQKMLLKLQNPPENLPVAARPHDEALSPEENLHTLDEKFTKTIERRHKRRLRGIATLSGAAIALSSLSFAYWQDVHANQELSLQSQPDIYTLDTENQDAVGESIFYFAGFDTRNGDVFGKKVGAGALHEIVAGSDMSIDYGDAPLEPTEIAKKIIAVADEKGLHTISLAGNSMGGDIAAEVAEYIITHSSLDVAAIILNSTPDGIKTLRHETQKDLSSMLSVLQAIPGSKYSTPVRWGITMAQENGRYTQGADFTENIQSFFSTGSEVWDWVSERRRPGAWLLVDQASAIMDSNLEDTLQKIGEKRGEKRMPVIITMRATNPNDDTVVDVEQASENICEYSEAALLDCFEVNVEGAIHTSYLYDSDAYRAALANHSEEITAAIEREATFSMLGRYSMTYFGLTK